MTVLFLTLRTDHQLDQRIKVIQPHQLDLYRDLLMRNHNSTATLLNHGTQTKDTFVLGYDIENRSVEPCKEGLLLSAFCNSNDEVLVIDNTCINNNEIFTEEILKQCTFVSHNADHEACWGVATNFLPMRFHCTMVNDKRLLSGQEGFRFDIISVINRRLGYKQIPIEMDKDIRSTFNDCTFFTTEQILYNAADTIRLKPILNKQFRIARENNQLYLLNTLNSRIIKPIASTEVRGIKHDTPKWLSIAKDRQQKAELIWEELNQIVNQTPGIEIGKINPAIKKQQESQGKKLVKNQERIIKLQNQLKQLKEKGKQHIKSYQITTEQLNKLNKTTTNGLNSITESNINWSSQKQVIEFLNQIGCPLPQAKSKTSHEIKPSIGKEGRANWFVENENSSFLPIMNLIDKQKKLIHNVNSFGEKWVQQYVRDGRAYTKLDQAGTNTGRFSSGSKGKKKTHYNGQQIPQGKEYRESFIADEGRAIITADYSNCEGIVMISLSGDLNMKAITEMSDSHSYLGTLCWRAVYKNRYDKTNDPKWLELANTYVMDKSTPEKEKERSKFKNSGGLFPVAYNVAANKVAATAGITLAEGQIMIDTIKAQIPKVITALDQKSIEGTTNGYVVHNSRSGSRRYFQAVLDNIHYKFPITKSQLVEIGNASRNTGIQGSNSDLMKEAIAMIELWKTLYKQDINLLLTVHDEVVYDCLEDKAEFYTDKIKQLMIRAANNYLIKEVRMSVNASHGRTWTK